MKKNLILMMAITSLTVFGQVGIGTSNPDSSAMLDVESTTKGLLAPRMTTTQRNDIALPAKGLIVYNTTLSCLQINDGTPASPKWKCINGLANPSTNGSAEVSNYGGEGCTGSATINGIMIQGVPISGVTMVIYANVTELGTYNISAVNNGVTFTGSGTFTVLGCQPVILTGSGTPTISGTFSWITNTFPAGVGVKNVLRPIGSYPTNFVNCGANTTVVDVTNPVTGRTWMDRNLGASRVATSRTDTQAYGDLYQWGRFADGHQCRTSIATNILSAAGIVPGHGNFIAISNSDAFGNTWGTFFDVVNWTNAGTDPCPSGYRIPTREEWEAEANSWPAGANGAVRAFASPLKLPTSGYREGSLNAGNLIGVGTNGNYYTSDRAGYRAYSLSFNSFNSTITTLNIPPTLDGHAIRCIKD